MLAVLSFSYAPHARDRAHPTNRVGTDLLFKEQHAFYNQFGKIYCEQPWPCIAMFSSQSGPLQRQTLMLIMNPNKGKVNDADDCSIK